MEAIEGDARSLDHVAVPEDRVGNEATVGAFLDVLVVRGMPPEAVSGSPAPFAQRRGGGGMIGVGVRDEDMRDAQARERPLQGFHMLRQERPGIDHRHLARADDVGAGPHEGVGTWIVRQHAADRRTEPHRLAIGRPEVAVEFDRHQM